MSIRWSVAVLAAFGMAAFLVERASRPRPVLAFKVAEVAQKAPRQGWSSPAEKPPAVPSLPEPIVLPKPIPGSRSDTAKEESSLSNENAAAAGRPPLPAPVSEYLKGGIGLYQKGDQVLAAKYLQVAADYREQLSADERVQLDDYRGRLEAKTVLATGVPTQGEPAGDKSDPIQDVEEWVKRNKKVADDSVEALTREAQALRDRLAKVEAALTRWKAVSDALRDGPGGNQLMPTPGNDEPNIIVPAPGQTVTAPATTTHYVAPDLTPIPPPTRGPAAESPPSIEVRSSGKTSPEPPPADPATPPEPKPREPRPSDETPIPAPR